MVEEGKISKNQAKNALYEAVEKEKNPIDIVKEQGVSQIQDESSLKEMVDKLLLEHPKEVDDYLNKGLTNVVNFFLGQVMKQTQGKANPAKTMQILKEELDKRKTN